MKLTPATPWADATGRVHDVTAWAAEAVRAFLLLDQADRSEWWKLPTRFRSYQGAHYRRDRIVAEYVKLNTGATLETVCSRPKKPGPVFIYMKEVKK